MQKALNPSTAAQMPVPADPSFDEAFASPDVSLSNMQASDRLPDESQPTAHYNAAQSFEHSPGPGI